MYYWIVFWRPFLITEYKICKIYAFYHLFIVMHIPIARQRLSRQACNEYATNNRVDPFLGNARNTRTQQ
jgi:hypothetical protein